MCPPAAAEVIRQMLALSVAPLALELALQKHSALARGLLALALALAAAVCLAMEAPASLVA